MTLFVVVDRLNVTFTAPAVYSASPMSLLTIATGMPVNGFAPIGSGSSRSGPPSLNTSTAAAPSDSARAILSTNGHVPRWISAILPVRSLPAQSVSSQPSVPDPGPPGGGSSAVPVVTIGAVTFPEPANWATM